MNYEERLKNIINSKNTPFVDIDTFLKYFPELKESKDEKIRKEIKMILANTNFSHFALEYTFADMIDWLEKQGNQREQLINKACNIVANCIEDYTWSEECKKQTLDGIRKKLEE